jgi:hypothetical protein
MGAIAHGTHIIATPELIALLAAGWSAPVQLAAAEVGGNWEILARTHTCDPAENGQMIRVQADPDGALELDCLYGDGRCQWSWYETRQAAPFQGYTVADLLRIAIGHQHRPVIDAEQTRDPRAHAEDARDA